MLCFRAGYPTKEMAGDHSSAPIPMADAKLLRLKMVASQTVLRPMAEAYKTRFLNSYPAAGRAFFPWRTETPRKERAPSHTVGPNFLLHTYFLSTM